MNEDRDESQGNITESESIAAEVPADEGVVTDNEFAADEEILDGAGSESIKDARPDVEPADDSPIDSDASDADAISDDPSVEQKAESSSGSQSITTEAQSDTVSAKDSEKPSKKLRSAKAPSAKMIAAVAGVAVVAGLGFMLFGSGKVQAISKAIIQRKGAIDSAVYEFEYDDKGLLSSASLIDFDLDEITNTYTYENGRVVEATVSDGFDEIHSTYEYDSHGNLTKSVEGNEDGEKTVTKAEYDGDRVAKVSEKHDDADDDSTTSTKYDDQGRIVSTVRKEASGTTATDKWEYDGSGRVTKNSYSSKDDDGDVFKMTFTNSFDDEGRLETHTITVEDTFKIMTRYSFNDAGQLVKETTSTDYESYRTDDTKSVTKYEYDEQGRIVRKIEVDSDEDKTITTYEWTDSGELASITEKEDGEVTKASFEYTKVKKSDAAKKYVIDVNPMPEVDDPSVVSEPLVSVKALIDNVME